MDIDSRLIDLLVRHEELHAQGRPAALEELCRDCPELLEPLRQHLRRLQAITPVLESQPSPQPLIVCVAHTSVLPSIAPDTETVPPTIATGFGHGFPATPRSSPLAARQVPGYEILGELGRGGMGIVYRARQIKANRIVALKMILSGAHADVAELARFRTEAEAIARLRHPNIVQVFEVGEHDGLPFFSLEFCEGGSLDRQLDDKPLAAAEAAALVEQLARAMHAAHEQQVIHRDLKPANILLASGVSNDPGSDIPGSLLTPLAGMVPKVTDFGLAKKLDDAGQTRSGAIMGSPSYMAPEQAAGNLLAIGPLTDVYALGAILYECLTGQAPFEGDTVPAVLDQVLNAEPVPPSRLNPVVPRDLETICLKCLRKDPALRYESALRLAQDLERFRTGDAILARREGLPRKLWRKVRRNRVLVAAALGVLLALTMSGVFFIREGEVRQERDLDAQAEEAIKRVDGTLASLDQAEERIADLAAVSSAKAAERTREFHERLASRVRDKLKQGRLWPADKEAVNSALDWLRGRDDGLAGTLRTLRDVRFTRTEPVFSLGRDSWNELPEVFDNRDVRRGSGDFLERVFPPEKYIRLTDTRKECRDDVQLEAVFDGPFERGSELGLMLFAEQPLTYVAKVHFSPNGQALITAEDNGRVTAWSLPSGQHFKALSRTPAKTQVALGSAGNRLLVAWIEPAALVVQEWDSTSFQAGRTLRCPAAGAITLALNASCTVLAAADRAGMLYLWDLPEGKEPLRLAGPMGSSPVLALSADGKQLAVGQGDALMIWDLRRGKEPRRLEAGQGKVLSLGFSPAGDRLAAGYDTEAVRLWDLVAGDLKPAHQTGILTAAAGLAFSPDGQFLAAFGNHAQFVFQGRDLRPRWHTLGPVRSLSFSPDGQQLATSQWKDMTIRMAADGKEYSRLGEQGYLFKLIVKPDGSGGQPASLETLRQHGGMVRLQVMRNSTLLWEEDRLLAAGPLTLRAGKERDQLRFQVNQAPPLLLRDVLPGGPRQGHYSILWPGGRLLRLHAEQKKPALVVPLERGDELFAQRRFAEALAFYQSQGRIAAASANGQAIRRECDCKAALCLDLLSGTDQALQLFASVARDKPADETEPWPLLAAFRLWVHHLDRNEFVLADRQYVRIQELDPDFRLSAAVISLTERERIWNRYQHGGDVDRYFFLGPDEMVRRQRVVDLAERFGLTPGHRLSAAYTLVTGLRATGQDREALRFLEKIGPLVVPSGTDTDNLLPHLLGHWTWLLRLEGRGDQALEELKRFPPRARGPDAPGALPHPERARGVRRRPGGPATGQ